MPALNLPTPSWSAIGDSAPSRKEATSAEPTAMAVSAVVSIPTAVPMMMFVAGPVFDALAISCTGRQLPDV